jgi:aminoglycoside 3-N-acetyltransferase
MMMESVLTSRRSQDWPAWSDVLLLVAERTAKQLYWSAPRLWGRMRRLGIRRRSRVQAAGREELRQHLAQIGVAEGALVMAHTSASGVMLSGRTGQDSESSFLTVAGRLVDDLVDLVGQTGTLVMPTHPAYPATGACQQTGGDAGVTVYDPARTPSGVGLANELFRRRQGVQRSLHPYNTLSACGPLAGELLHDNLNECKPLAHGVHSGYYRFCQRNGLVVSIGIPLRRCLTLLHVAEDVRDRDWPVKDFFVERRYIVCIDGRDQPWVVRQPRPEYLMYCLCWRKATRDLLRAGILHEGRVGGLRVDWAHSREVFDFCMSRNQASPYPYYGTWLVRATRKSNDGR